MYILFLDDLRERYEHFRRSHPDDRVIWAPSAYEFRAILSIASRFDEIWMDHDLEEADATEDGQDAAMYIAMHLEHSKYPDRIVIHSWNPEGTLDMLDILEPTGIPIQSIPYPVVR